MKRLLLAATAVLAFAAAQPTLAADAPIYRKGPAPVAAALFNWSGFYIGINGGYAWGTTQHTNAQNLASSGPHDISGWLLGATYGFNWQMGALVLGLEGDISWSGIRAVNFPDNGNGFCGTSQCLTDLHWLGTNRVRVGFAWDRMLLFAAGGIAYGQVEAGIPGSGCCTQETIFRSGWTVGGGLEAAFAPNWSAKLEYLYVDLGETRNYQNLGGISELVLLRFHTVRAGLNWRF